jgi:hypothetical protein
MFGRAATGWIVVAVLLAGCAEGSGSTQQLSSEAVSAETLPTGVPVIPDADAAQPAPPAESTTTTTSPSLSCPKDGTVYAAGSCTRDPSVMPAGAPAGTPLKYCSGNWECPADYPETPGPCRTTDYRSCENYRGTDTVPTSPDG